MQNPFLGSDFEPFLQPPGARGLSTSTLAMFGLRLNRLGSPAADRWDPQPIPKPDPPPKPKFPIPIPKDPPKSSCSPSPEEYTDAVNNCKAVCGSLSNCYIVVDKNCNVDFDCVKDLGEEPPIDLFLGG